MALIEPFDMSGIVRDQRGVKHFTDLPGSMVEMLRRSVDATDCISSVLYNVGLSADGFAVSPIAR